MWFDISTAGTAKTKASVNAKVVAIQLRQAGGLLFFSPLSTISCGLGCIRICYVVAIRFYNSLKKLTSSVSWILLHSNSQKIGTLQLNLRFPWKSYENPMKTTSFAAPLSRCTASFGRDPAADATHPSGETRSTHQWKYSVCFGK